MNYDKHYHIQTVVQQNTHLKSSNDTYFYYLLHALLLFGNGVTLFPFPRSEERRLDGSAEKRRLNYDPWWRIVSIVTELSMVLKHTAHSCLSFCEYALERWTTLFWYPGLLVSVLRLQKTRPLLQSLQLRTSSQKKPTKFILIFKVFYGLIHG